MARRVTTGQHPTRRSHPADTPLPRRAAATLPQQLNAVRSHWDATAAMSEQTRLRIDEIIGRYSTWLQARGTGSFTLVTPRMAEAFVLAHTREGAPPIVATTQARRTSLRLLYRTLRALGEEVGDPTLDLHLPPKGSKPARPLTDDEVALCRITAQLSLQRGAALRPVHWALGEATAISSEISKIRIRDLDTPRRPATVDLPGTIRHTARTVPLTAWGARVLGAHASALLEAGQRPDSLLAYSGDATPGGATAQASACNTLRVLMDRAGLGTETDVRPASLRHWAARASYDQGAPIHQVAILLGVTSLDTAAENIHLQWRQPLATRQETR